MARVIQPWQILLAALAGWINQQQQDVIEYLREENRLIERDRRVSSVSRPVVCRERMGGLLRYYQRQAA